MTTPGCEIAGTKAEMEEPFTKIINLGFFIPHHQKGSWMTTSGFDI
jgi:hypothetical protein